MRRTYFSLVVFLLITELVAFSGMICLSPPLFRFNTFKELLLCHTNKVVSSLVAIILMISFILRKQSELEWHLLEHKRPPRQLITP